jgi:hypothetical protein
LATLKIFSQDLQNLRESLLLGTLGKRAILGQLRGSTNISLLAFQSFCHGLQHWGSIQHLSGKMGRGGERLREILTIRRLKLIHYLHRSDILSLSFILKFIPDKMRSYRVVSKQIILQTLRLGELCE